MAGRVKSNSPAEREARVSGVAARYLAEHGLPEDLAGEPGARRVLVVDDHDGALLNAVRRAGGQAQPWWRFARRGHRATAWPAEGTVDLAILRLPSDWPAFEMMLHACCARLRPGGRLWVLGGNDEGIKSAPKRMRDLVGPVETLWIKARVRLLEAVRPQDLDLKAQLEDWAVDQQLDLPGAGATAVRSYPGLFARGRLDEGTALLLDHLPPIAVGARVLDYGCGPGAISLAVAARQPAAQQVLCDVDALAVHAARHNLPGSLVLQGDGWAAVELGARFDLVLSNPPLHQGKAEDRSLLDAFVQQLPLRLREHGEARFVTWRTANAARIVEKIMGKATVLAEDRRYQVIQARLR